LGWFTKIALDSDGNPHILYQDETTRTLKYAFWNQSYWYVETVDPAAYVGGDISFVLDSQNRPHISYFDYQANGSLKYAHTMGNVWNIQIIESTGTAAWLA